MAVSHTLEVEVRGNDKRNSGITRVSRVKAHLTFVIYVTYRNSLKEGQTDDPKRGISSKMDSEDFLVDRSNVKCIHNSVVQEPSIKTTAPLHTTTLTPTVDTFSCKGNRKSA